MKHLSRYPLGLEHPFLRLSKHDALTLGDMVEHVIVLGETGSGKTSGPGRALLTQYMRLGFGGLILTYKSDEVARIQAIARATRRQDSLIVIAPGSVWRGSLLAWEVERPGAGAAVDNATAFLMEAIKHNTPDGAQASKDPVWEQSCRRLVRQAMLLIRAAGDRITIEALKAVVDGIPDSNPAGGLLWPSGSYLQDCLVRAKARGADAHTVRFCETYFCRELTRPGAARFVSSVLATFYNSSDAFQSPLLADLLFADSPTFTVDMFLKGCIGVLALPIAAYTAIGRTAALLLKASFINAALRRQGLEGGRPAFIMIDEYQFTSTSLDAKAMQAGRSSCLSFCALTQGLPGLYAVQEPGRATHVVDAMMGNFGIVILCRNRCHVTNEWASKTLGKAMVARANWGESTSEGTNEGGSHGVNRGRLRRIARP